MFCLKLLGKTWFEKIIDIKKRLTDESADMFVVTALDEIACKLFRF